MSSYYNTIYAAHIETRIADISRKIMTKEVSQNAFIRCLGKFHRPNQINWLLRGRAACANTLITVCMSDDKGIANCTSG